MILYTEFDPIWRNFQRSEKDLFLTFVNCETRNFPYLNLIFSRQVLPQVPFVLDSRYNWYTPNRVWFNWKNFLTLRKRYFFKIRFSRKSQISVWEPNFFLGKLYQKFFLLYTLLTMVILHTEFGLFEKLLEPMKKQIFENRYSKKISNFPYVNLISFSRQAIPQILLF